MNDAPSFNTPPRGPAVYFDGTSSARNDVIVEAGAKACAFWRAAIRARIACSTSGPMPICAACRRPKACSASGGAAKRCWRVSRSARRSFVAGDGEDRAEALDRGGVAERRLRRKIVALSFAAAASLVVTAVFGLPALASRIIPLVPLAAEHRLGDAIDRNIRGVLDSQHLGAAFACGSAPSETAGRAALDKLVGKLEAVAALPFPLHVEVVRRAEPNAMALPGGRVYVDDGLIAIAQTPDELAGVLAHEIGHVAHRDGTRTVLQTAGLSFLFGMMLGDFVGGGAVVIAARTVLKSSYSRRVEAAADAYSVDLMAKAGGDPHALAAILKRIVGDKKEGMKLLLDHPETKDRIAAIDAVAVAGTPVPLLDAADWSALKQICAPLPPNATGNVTAH